MKPFPVTLALSLALLFPAAGPARAAAWSPARETLTCREIRRDPTAVLSREIDLGSSIYTPTDVDFGCPGGLETLPLLQPLLRLGDAIRGVPICSGKLAVALGRYYSLDLLKAGLAPRLFLQQAEARGEPGARVPEAIKRRYFDAWSRQSFSSFRLHEAFLAESARVQPKLAEHYRRQFHLPEATARAVARQALARIADWAFGVFPSRNPPAEPPPLVRLSLERESTAADLERALAAYPSQEELDQALKVALLQGKPRPYLELLVDRLDTLETGDESAIFFALGRRGRVESLLARGAAVDHANGFGKTPLFYAIELGDLRLVELLLDHGADVNHPYKSRAELEPAADPSIGVCSPYGALRGARRTPLMHAAQHAGVRMLALLVRRGARPKDKDETGAGALDHALAAHRPENAAFLRSLRLPPG